VPFGRIPRRYARTWLPRAEVLIRAENPSPQPVLPAQAGHPQAQPAGPEREREAEFIGLMALKSANSLSEAGIKMLDLLGGYLSLDK